MKKRKGRLSWLFGRGGGAGDAVAPDATSSRAFCTPSLSQTHSRPSPGLAGRRSPSRDFRHPSSFYFGVCWQRFARKGAAASFLRFGLCEMYRARIKESCGGSKRLQETKTHLIRKSGGENKGPRPGASLDLSLCSRRIFFFFFFFFFPHPSIARCPLCKKVKKRWSSSSSSSPSW